MTDYSKNTVVQLRDIFKSRGVPTTGLTKKQQLIDRLLELDAANADAPIQDGSGNAAGEERREVADGDTPALDGAADGVNGEEVVAPAPEAAQVQTAAPVDAVPSDEVKNGPDGAPMVDEPAPAAPVEASPVQASAAEQTVVPSKEEPIQQSLDSKEAIPLSATPDAESKKRKRRSLTPPVLETEVAAKKARQEEDSNARPNVVLQEDLEDPTKPTGTKLDSPTAPTKLPSPSNSPSAPTKLPPSIYKDLISPNNDSPVVPTNDAAADELEAAPALHHATPALYISNLMRPLKDQALKAHLAALSLPATSEIASIDADALVPTFHLDAIKATALAVFPSTAAAARARTALHDRVWPPEANRKPLWVDFVPEERVPAWIDEMSPARRGPLTRWEVAYERDAEGVIIASLREAGAHGPSRPAPAAVHESSRMPVNVPTGPAAERKPPQAPVPTPASFTALEKLFNSTTAKPVLYYLPVAAAISERRLEIMTQRSSRTVPEGGPMCRFTFEADELVNGGPEFGMRGAGRGGGAAGRGRGRGDFYARGGRYEGRGGYEGRGYESRSYESRPYEGRGYEDRGYDNRGYDDGGRDYGRASDYGRYRD